MTTFTMSLRTVVMFCLALGLGAAQAGTVEDLFRKLIDQRKAAGQTLLDRLPTQRVPQVTKPMILPREDGLKLGRDQIAMFTTPGCRACDAAAQRLKQRGFKVELLDLSRSATAREAYQLTGAQGAPTVLFGGHMLSGYSDALFDRLLKLDFMERTQDQQGTGA
jgi:glutaredoxin